jgi:hypothetical protein
LAGNLEKVHISFKSNFLGAFGNVFVCTRKDNGEKRAVKKIKKIDGEYDYLMKLPVSSFTAEQIAKHENHLAELKAEIMRLQSLEAADMWLMELSVV